MTAPPRIPLALLPTPLERLDRLSAAWGGPKIWAKRDDLTGFGLSGNKVRKLEYHLAAALADGADTVVTCGAVQSNHCRATALAAARVGLGTVLYLRSGDGDPPATVTGNHLLARLGGAEARFIDPDAYQQRDHLMAGAAASLGDAWVIPEGASDGLGMYGFVTAMEEIAAQLSAAGVSPTAIWHAGSSGGTTAGMVLGAALAGLETTIAACSVGDTEEELRDRLRIIREDAASLFDIDPAEGVPLEIVDDHIGGGYGITSPAEMETQKQASALTGMLFDPTYTGKALHGLRREIEAGRYGPGDDVVFWHTGGGFAVFAHDYGF